MMIKKVVLALLATGVLVGAYVYFFMLNKSHPDYENLEADLNISAIELYKDCQNGNALKYTGKILEVYGTPTHVETADTRIILVYVYNEGLFGPEGIRATLLPDFNEKTIEVDLSQPILIKAYCTGFNDTDVILEKASIIQPQNLKK